MLRRRSVRLRIVVLVLVPLVALIGLYGVVLSLTLGSLFSFQQGSRVGSEVTTPVSNVQIQVGAERALALQYLADPSHTRLAKLLGQEPRSDAAVRAYLTAKAAAQRHAGAGELRAMRAWANDLAILHELRTTVVSLGLSRAAAAASYSVLVTGGNNVINQALYPLLDTPGVVQANDLVTLDESLQSVAEESDLFSADLTARSYPAADQHLLIQLIVQRRQLLDEGMTGLNSAYQNYFKNDIPASTSSTLSNLEDQITSGPHNALRVSPPAWVATNAAYDLAFRKALDSGARSVENLTISKARGLLLRLILVGGVGLLAILTAVAIAVIVSRTLLQQLSELRQSALSLSSQRLPAILARLRAGEEIDVGADTPQLEAGPSEIGQLQEAINVTARTAIGAAIDEVALRRGVNDVFRNLARRNQSLLTRQLELLDAMERRVHDPEELADLFRVDHLTTRMRRHAEGLLIVAGGSSGRVWRDPVPIMDVMRAAVAEIEDYTRIRVTSRTTASVAGHAVADIIHLLAEIVENATTFSPANTPVRIEADSVAKGLIVEIEDRGLGMSETQLAELNSKLSDPPTLDLSGSEQLGLFIAGQLAKRHDVRITMRGSAYGGIAAVVLIPSPLVMDSGYAEPLTAIGIRELGGRPVPQLPGPSRQAPDDGLAAMAGTGDTGYGPGTGYLVDLESAATAVTTTATQVGAVYRGRDTSADDPLSDLLAGSSGNGASDRGGASPEDRGAADGSGSDYAQAEYLADYNPASYNSEPPMLVLGPVADPSGPAAEFGLVDPPSEPAPGPRPVTDFGPVTDYGPANDIGRPEWAAEIDAGLGRPAADPPAGWPLTARSAPETGNGGAHAAPGSDRSMGGPAGWPDGSPAAQGWLNLPGSSTPSFTDAPSSAGGPGGPSGYGDLTAQPASASGDSAALAGEPAAGLGPFLPKRQPRTPSLSFGDDDTDTGSFTSPFAASQRRQPSGPDPLPEPEQPAAAELDGLPVRVRQANLAPQLRESASAASHSSAQQFVAAPEMPGDSAAAAQQSAVSVPPNPPVGDPSPEAARNFMSALQRGWERGRSMAEQITEESDGEQS